MPARADPFRAFQPLKVEGRTFKMANLSVLEEQGLVKLDELPISIRILIESVLRNVDGDVITEQSVKDAASWKPNPRDVEIPFMPSRVLLQDFTGVPAVVDLAIMRDAMAKLGGDPDKINPLVPADLVIDHSVQVDVFHTKDALARNLEWDYRRNKERYQLLKWAQQAFRNFTVVPPGMGICHQVNLEYLGKVVHERENGKDRWAFPDTLVGMDSHTTMIGGIGVVGWGVGGIEAEGVMLGQPYFMKLPEVIGFRLENELPEGATATDLVLTITDQLRKLGVVDKFIEFYGPGLKSLTAQDRATIANMAPEQGSTISFFPVDQVTLDYLSLTGRSPDHVKLVEAYCKAQRLWAGGEPKFTKIVELDLSSVEPSLAGPSRPHDLVTLKSVHSEFDKALEKLVVKKAPIAAPTQRATERLLGEGGRNEGVLIQPIQEHPHVQVSLDGQKFELTNGSVVISAITSCTNTSNPSVMLAAGLLAKKAVEAGLERPPWVKTSLAPGSRVVTDYLEKAGLLPYLEKLGFDVVAYGCTTCIGNAGPLADPIERAIKDNSLVTAAVLSGNRNFEARIHPLVRANYLASPPLVLAYALAGTVAKDLQKEPLGKDKEGKPVFLKDLWPSAAEIRQAMKAAADSDHYRKQYAVVMDGDENWKKLPVRPGKTYAWDNKSTYVRAPPYFDDFQREPPALRDVTGARVLAVFGDSITTDHISPAGSIDPKGAAGQWLIKEGVEQKDFNQYGARRGNHEVMIRGTFGNVRIKNLLVAPQEGSVTVHHPSGEKASIFEVAERYRKEGTSLVVMAGKEYGSGSSRDWAAKGTLLLGVRAAIAQSFERIHRSNLIGMGVLPLQFLEGQDPKSLGLDGSETLDISGVAALKPRGRLKVTATKKDGSKKTFEVLARLDTPAEITYYRNGGILPTVLRRLAAN